MSLIIRKAQFNYVDVWDASKAGWADNHTRVQVKKKSFGDKTQQPLKVFYHSGKPLEKIRYVEIAKSL